MGKGLEGSEVLEEVEGSDDGMEEREDVMDKVTGTFPRTSGFRPIFLAAVALKSSAFCARVSYNLGLRSGDSAL